MRRVQNSGPIYYSCEFCCFSMEIHSNSHYNFPCPRCSHIFVPNQIGSCQKCGISPVLLYPYKGKNICAYCARQKMGEITPILDSENENDYFEYYASNGKHIAACIANDLATVYYKDPNFSRASGSYGSFKVFKHPSGHAIGIKKSVKYSNDHPYSELQDELTILQRLYGDFFFFQHNYMTEKRTYGGRDYSFERRYITIPYCDGLTLLKYFQSLKTEKKLHFRAYFCEVCKVFYVLSLIVERNHLLEVSHNDIREDNVIVNDIPGENKYEAFLIDYGLARRFGLPVFDLDPHIFKKNTIPPEFFVDYPNNAFLRINNKHDPCMLGTMFIRILSFFFSETTINNLCSKIITTLSNDICTKITDNAIPSELRQELMGCSNFIKDITQNFTNSSLEGRGDVVSLKNKFKAFLCEAWNINVTEETLIPLGYRVNFKKQTQSKFSCPLM